MTTLMTIRKERFKLEADLQVLRGSNHDERSRSIQTLVAQIASLDQQMKLLQDEMTSSGTTADGQQNLTDALLAYEGLLVERTIAEKLEESAHILYDAPGSPPPSSTSSWRRSSNRSCRRSRSTRSVGAPFVTAFCFLVVWSSFAPAQGRHPRSAELTGRIPLRRSVR